MAVDVRVPNLMRVHTDGEATVSAEGATLELCDTLEKAGPYGSGHPAPVFALPRHRIADAREVGNGHVRLDLQSLGGARLPAIAFRAAQSDLGSFLFSRRGSSVHLAGTLSVNHWNGRQSVQMAPSLRFYPAQREPIGTPAVLTRWSEDLYLTLMSVEEDGRAGVRAIVTPGVAWIWAGVFVIAAGMVVCLLDRAPPASSGAAP